MLRVSHQISSPAKPTGLAKVSSPSVLLLHELAWLHEIQGGLTAVSSVSKIPRGKKKKEKGNK